MVDAYRASFATPGPRTTLKSRIIDAIVAVGRESGITKTRDERLEPTAGRQSAGEPAADPEASLSLAPWRALRARAHQIGHGLVQETIGRDDATVLQLERSPFKARDPTARGAHDRDTGRQVPRGEALFPKAAKDP